MQQARNQMIRTEFAAAIAQIANERKIPAESIYEAIRQAMVSAYRKEIDSLDEEMHYFARIDEATGEAHIYKAPITKQDEETLEVLEWDESKAEEVTPAGFGRIAAQTAKQVILQKIRESEKDQIIADFSSRLGEIVTAQILRMDGKTVVLDLGRGQGYMPPEEQMRGEFYRMNTRITVYISDIRDTHRGRRVIVSRADKTLVSKLFEREVPEVASGAVEIVSVAREAGVRTKLSVRSAQEGVDPVGSCVGQRGVRVQEVIRELNNEKIDIIPFSEDMVTYIQGALAPAENLKIEINDKKQKAVVTVPEDQLSLAIGRGGQNVRLAAKLTGYQITITSGGKVQTEATGEEQYEIDTFEGLTPESREYLIQNKLTTTNDLDRFADKWLAAKELEQDQKDMLFKRVEERRAADAAREAEMTVNALTINPETESETATDATQTPETTEEKA